jgi:hypothetical protein
MFVVQKSVATLAPAEKRPNDQSSKETELNTYLK